MGISAVSKAGGVGDHVPQKIPRERVETKCGLNMRKYGYRFTGATPSHIMRVSSNIY